MMPVISCISFPFSAPCNDMLAMLVCATRCLSLHFYTLAYMPMHESCLLTCRLYFNTIKLWTFDPNLHLSLTNTTFCLLPCLLVCCLFCSFACIHAMLGLSIMFIYFMPLYCAIFTFLPLLICWLSCCYLCMYTHGARTHEARARSPRCKQKGQECEHADMSQATAVSRFRVLAFSLLLCTL